MNKIVITFYHIFPESALWLNKVGLSLKIYTDAWNTQFDRSTTSIILYWAYIMKNIDFLGIKPRWSKLHVSRIFSEYYSHVCGRLTEKS